MTTRRALYDPTDPAGLQPEQRLHEVAAIVAAGVIRMRGQRAVSMPKVRPCRNHRSTGSPKRGAGPCMSQIPSDSGENCLELPRRSSPDGQCG